MSSEIIPGVAYDNHDDLQQVNFIFSQIFISPCWGLFNEEINPRVRYILEHRWVQPIIFGSLKASLVVGSRVFFNIKKSAEISPKIENYLTLHY